MIVAEKEEEFKATVERTDLIDDFNAHVAGADFHLAELPYSTMIDTP